MRQFFLCAAMAVILAGCSAPVHVQQDANANLSSYRTYSWVDTRASETDNSSRASAYADIGVRNAANKELEKAGWREVTGSPDIFISYDILVERSKEQRSDPVFTRPYSRTFFNPYRQAWVSVYYPSELVGYQNYTAPVKEGTVTISLTDANTDKLVWQGWTTERMGYTRLTESQIDRVVHNIFRKFDAAVHQGRL